MSTEPTDSLAPLRVQLLGEVCAWRGVGELPLGSARQRALFAVLALRANTVVSRDELVDAIWGDAPPGAVGSSLYTYVSRLRRALEPVRSKWSTGSVLVSEGSGYSLRLDPAALDVDEFDRLRDEARHLWAAGEAAPALAALEQALELWHGEALTGIAGPFAARHRGRLAELHLDALERRAEIMAFSGETEGAIEDLLALTSAHPLRETPRALLMTALHRAGRDDEALAVYRAARELLVDQLGIEPGPQLRQAHEAVTSGRGRGFAVSTAPVPPLLPEAPQAFAGRVDELDAVRHALKSAVHGTGTALWVEGEPGAGKSALLAAALADAQEFGCAVRWHAGDETDDRFPLGVVTEALNAQLPDSPPQVESEDLIVLVDHLVRTVHELCESGPVVLVLEDLQWADDASLLVWQRLARTAPHLPLLLVGSARPLPARPELDPLRTAVAAYGGIRLRLGPLDEIATTELVRQAVGADPSSELLAVVDCAAGNPLVVLAVVDALVRDDAVVLRGGAAHLDRRPGAPQPAMDAVVSGLMDHLSGNTRRLLRWAALLGMEFSLNDLATVAREQASGLLPAVEEATAGRVIRESGRRLAFEHPMLRRVLYEAVPATARIALHRQAAETLDTAGAHVERISEQLLAGPVPVDAWVTQWLLTHSNTLASRNPSLAAELLEYAVASPSTRDRAREVFTVRLARLLFWLGRHPVTEARAVLKTTEDPTRAAEMRLMLAYMDHATGENDRALEVLRQVAADPAVPAHWRARHHSLQARVERRTLDDPNTAHQTAVMALDRARESADTFAIAHASENLWEIASVQGRHVEALAHVDQALQAIGGDPAGADLELCLLDDKVFTLQQLDRLGAASRTLDAAQHLVIHRGLSTGPHLPAAVHHYWLGSWHEALSELDAVVQDRPEITFYGLRQRTSIDLLHGVKALIAAHRDDSAALETFLKSATDYPRSSVEARDDFLRTAHSVAAEQRGRPDEAMVALLPLLRTDYPRLVPRHQWLPRLTRLALDRGEREVATAALAACDSRTPRGAVAERWCRALIEEDPAALAAVTRHLAEVGRKVEYATASEDLAVLHASLGDAPEAQTALYDAMTVYTELGATWDVRRTESRLKPYDVRWRIGVHSDLTGRPLDPLESRVADLVAAGWPNSDIATRLGMSRNTVQAHVSRLLQKLGVDSRLSVTRQVLDRHTYRAGEANTA
ncbi:BTAD domain-containing putative transcriptional regulator [Lentzea sp. NBRC 102530]|uniref:BTAD domain-containing putative transcriptional regulator n=1 Tax=Lentzea sp. NBRC 102530 TaxID=3032201 RepID=UPI0025550C13|nr:BTAD domain-containing putative transcriptional regulator [Lentzea sp. NBRC 102530]